MQTTRAIAYRVPVEVCAAWTIVELSLKEHAAISSRILAVRLTCGALPPWKSHTFVPRRRCPVSASDVSHKKDRSQRKSRMDQRTRERLPVLPALVSWVAAERGRTAGLLAAAEPARPGQLFTAAGVTLRRAVDEDPDHRAGLGRGPRQRSAPRPQLRRTPRVLDLGRGRGVASHRHLLRGSSLGTGLCSGRLRGSEADLEILACATGVVRERRSACYRCRVAVLSWAMSSRFAARAAARSWSRSSSCRRRSMTCCSRLLTV